MSNITGLQQLAVDLEQRVVQEMQFTGDAERQAVEAFKMLHEAVDHAETIIMNMFQARGRSLAAIIGNGKLNPETVDVSPPKSKKIHAVASEG